jgi:hypothetical protein
MLGFVVAVQKDAERPNSPKSKDVESKEVKSKAVKREKEAETGK